MQRSGFDSKDPEKPVINQVKNNQINPLGNKHLEEMLRLNWRKSTFRLSKVTEIVFFWIDISQ
jgi:hypothetical protein